MAVGKREVGAGVFKWPLLNAMLESSARPPSHDGLLQRSLTREPSWGRSQGHLDWARACFLPQSPRPWLAGRAVERPSTTTTPPPLGCLHNSLLCLPHTHRCPPTPGCCYLASSRAASWLGGGAEIVGVLRGWGGAVSQQTPTGRSPLPCRVPQQGPRCLRQNHTGLWGSPLHLHG